MAQLLHIDASPRGTRSHSRGLTQEFVDTWLKSHPADTVVYRDVGHCPPSPVDEAWIAAAFTAADERIQKMRDTLKKATIWLMNCWPLISWSSASLCIFWRSGFIQSLH